MTTSADRQATVILGAASGIGGNIARAFATTHPERHLTVTYHSDPNAAEALIEAIGRGEAVRCDVSDDNSLRSLCTSLDRRGLHVSSLVHCAVQPIPGRLLDLSDQLGGALDVSAVSLVRAVSCLQPVLEDGSSVVYLTSIGSSRAIPGYASVGVAKAAGEAIVRYLASELGIRGIRVNAVGSGPSPTKALGAMFGDGEAVVRSASKRSPLQPASDADDVAALIVALCGTAGRGVTGQVLSVDGGLFLS